MNSRIRNNATTGIYLHFPYCIQKCSYCDFYSIGMENSSSPREVTKSALRQFEDAIKIELDTRLETFKQYSSADTVYFGGGTSSLMPPDTIARFLSLFRSRIGLTPNCEITLEGNPENFTPDYLNALHAIGVTRVNVGIQTFSGKFLREMNRYFDHERYSSILNDLESSPIKNIGADLIYGFPGQGKGDFYDDLKKTLKTNLNHLSIYSLTAEAGTPYATRIERAQTSAPNEDLQFQIFSELSEFLREHGYQQYEISNFAKPGHACHHNARYWNYESYMGLGPGAHGFTGTHRYANTRNIPAWTAEPAGARNEEHNPIYDLPLNVLRLMTPIDVRIFTDVLGPLPKGDSLTRIATNTIESWVDRGFGQWLKQGPKIEGASSQTKSSQDLFIWNFEGYSQLNDRTLEMIESLENAS